MGAVMGASLQAPLAALVAMMELTYSPGIIMPGMVVIVVASLTSSELFHKESLFVTMLKVSGMDYTTTPVQAALRRIGVASVMSRSFVSSDAVIDAASAAMLLQSRPAWILVNGEEAPVALLRAVDLANHLKREERHQQQEQIDLLEIPAQRLNIRAVHLQATLLEALEQLDQSSAMALYVQRRTAPGVKRIYGVLTRDMVESAYL
jgi:hypothetical protein